MKTIMGYSDKISVCPGEVIKFMVSCSEQPSYRARLVRIIHGDTSPEGPGYKEAAVDAPFEGEHKARKQEIHAGSHVIVPANALFDSLASFSVQALVWPTTPEKGRQTIIALEDENGRGFTLGIDDGGALCLTLGDGRVTAETVSNAK
jgi:N,N-dimethylformamidase